VLTRPRRSDRLRPVGDSPAQRQSALSVRFGGFIERPSWGPLVVTWRGAGLGEGGDAAEGWRVPILALYQPCEDPLLASAWGSIAKSWKVPRLAWRRCDRLPRLTWGQVSDQQRKQVKERRTLVTRLLTGRHSVGGSLRHLDRPLGLLRIRSSAPSWQKYCHDTMQPKVTLRATCGRTRARDGHPIPSPEVRLGAGAANAPHLLAALVAPDLEKCRLLPVLVSMFGTVR